MPIGQALAKSGGIFSLGSMIVKPEQSLKSSETKPLASMVSVYPTRPACRHRHSFGLEMGKSTLSTQSEALVLRHT